MKTLSRILLALVVILVMNSCANTGRPSGGLKDEEPPVIIESTPEMNELGYSEQQLTIKFDEIVVLRNLNDYFLVSPPTEEKPIVKAYGKELVVEFEDTLQSNTTYTLYFGNGIVDNNEGNPLADFAFSFSTGYEIDTMRLQGKVVDAETLSPESGIIVGIYANYADSAFTNSVPLRIAKTDDKGYFSVNNVKPGKYIVRALSEMDGDYRFNQNVEKIAFLNDKFETSQESIILLDSIFLDSIGENDEHIHVFQEIRERDTIVYYPDDILLFAFTEYHPFQAIKEKKREQEDRLDYGFASKIVDEPRIKLLEDESREDWYISEYSTDSLMISYWVKDTALIKLDTIAVILDYQVTDTLEQYVWKTDTLQMRFKRKQKSARQQRRDDKKEAETPKVKALNLAISIKGAVNYFDDITITSPQPLESIKEQSIHLYEEVNDSTVLPIKYKLEEDKDLPRTYRIVYKWNQEKKYQLSIDSAAFYDIYGATNDSIGRDFSIVSEDKFSTIFLNISNLKSNAVVQMMNASLEVLETQEIKSDEELGFYYLKPNKYYFSLFYDTNNNGKWDPGSYEENRQAEEVRFFPKAIVTKAYYEMEENWDVELLPILQQKPLELNSKKK